MKAKNSTYSYTLHSLMHQFIIIHKNLTQCVCTHIWSHLAARQPSHTMPRQAKQWHMFLYVWLYHHFKTHHIEVFITDTEYVGAYSIEHEKSIIQREISTQNSIIILIWNVLKEPLLSFSMLNTYTIECALNITIVVMHHTHIH